MSWRSARRRSTLDRRIVLAFLGAALVGVLACCWAVNGLVNWIKGPDATPTPEPSSALTVAYSPEKEATFQELVRGFNAQGLKTAEGEPLAVTGVPLDPEAMLDQVLNSTAGFQAITPDSSVWLEQLDSAWNQARGSNAQVIGETRRYAISPVVIAAWEGVAREMGWPDRAVSWQDLLSRARSDPNFRWSHPSTSSASGMLSVLAEFYAATGKTRGLTIEDVTAGSTLDYVGTLEKTVRYYGEGNEPQLIERALREGRAFLDAFVIQEQGVVAFNQQRQGQERLVALYPAEGTLWQDHPLALLETAGLTPLQRQAFASFADYLLSAEAQALILGRGYRPADPALPLDGPQSPLTAENGVDPAEPETTLQVPNVSVIGVVRDVWWYTKRHTNVVLIADRSGSMTGEKLAQAQEALSVFLEHIRGDEERVGLIDFSTYVNTSVPLDRLGSNRTALQMSVDNLEANGDTALLDAVHEAHGQLQALADAERINAVVVMTDGKENASYISLRSLVNELRRASPVPVVIFCVAYGGDADLDMLQSIAEPSGGEVLQGDLETIRGLYKILSTRF